MPLTIEKKFSLLCIPDKVSSFNNVCSPVNCPSNPKDLNYINRINLELCLDLSHFILSCNYHEQNFSKNFTKYEKLFKHYHIADASGFDSEGLELGDGDLVKKHLKILKKIINNNNVKVLEVWQGHLNKGSAFKNEINKIFKINEK